MRQALSGFCRSLLEHAGLLFRRPPRRQIAALCYKRAAGESRVLLITSRGGERWILPKGWPMPDRQPHETAATEAYEEAGVTGKAARRRYATYRSLKGVSDELSVPIRVDVYLLETEGETERFPETGQRRKRWLPAGKAAELVDDDGLRGVLKQFAAHGAQ